MKSFLFRLLTVLVAFTGCQSKPLEQSEVVGTFRASFDPSRETIVFRNDGTYTHEISPSSGNEGSKHDGKWYIDGAPKERRITLEKFQSRRMPITGQEPTLNDVPAFWNVEVKRSGNEVRLEVNPDTGDAFVKNN